MATSRKRIKVRDQVPPTPHQIRTAIGNLSTADRQRFTKGARAKIKYDSTKKMGRAFLKYTKSHVEKLHLNKRRQKKLYEIYAYTVSLKDFPEANSDHYIASRIFIDENKKLWGNFRANNRVKNNKQRKQRTHKTEINDLKNKIQSLDKEIRKIKAKKIPENYLTAADDFIEGIYDYLNNHKTEQKTHMELPTKELATIIIFTTCHLIESGWLDAPPQMKDVGKIRKYLRSLVPAMLSMLPLPETPTIRPLQTFSKYPQRHLT